jgi:hypothetical protein
VVNGSRSTHKADLRRDDLLVQYPTWGPDHGFDIVVPLEPGTWSVCVIAEDYGHEFQGAVLGCSVEARPG